MTPARRLVVVALAALLVAPASAGAATRLGPDIAAAGAPDEDCGAVTCSAVGLDGAAIAVPSDGVLTSLQLRHGPATGGLATAEVRLVAYQRAGLSLTAVRESGAVTVPATTDADRTDTLAVSLPVRAGELVGMKVASGWAGSELKVLGAAAGQTAARYAGNHLAGATATYAALADRAVLFNATLQADANGNGLGDEDEAGAGGGAGTPPDATPGTEPGGGGTPTPADAGARPGACATGTGPGPQAGAARDNVNHVDVALDGRGRAHAIARGVFRNHVFYAGPGGTRVLENAQTDGQVALALDRRGRPVTLWGSAPPEVVNGLVRYCPRLNLATGPGFGRTILFGLPDGTKALSLADLAADPRTGTLHTVYDIAGRLVHQPLGGRAQTVPGVADPHQLRISFGGGTLAVAVRDARDTLTVLTRRGNGSWRRALRVRGAGDFDVAVGSDGRPRLAIVRGAVPRLSIYNGRRLVHTALPAQAVGVGVSTGGRIHVGFSLRSRPSRNPFGTAANGLVHLASNASATRGRLGNVERSVGFSPARIAVAVRGSRVAFAYGHPGRSGRLTVRTRRG